MWKYTGKVEKIKKPKNVVTHLDVHDGLGNLEQTNVINVELKSTNIEESNVKRIEPNPPLSLRDHFYPPWTFPQLCFDPPLIAKDVTLELNPNYVLMLPKFTGFATTTPPSMDPAFAGSMEIQM